VDRRSFLRRAAGFTAGLVAPAAIAAASKSEIDAAWHRLSANPLRFCVDQGGTIWDPSETDPERRRDLYPEVDPAAWRAQGCVMQAAQACYALHDFLESRAASAFEELELAAEEEPSGRWSAISALLEKNPTHDWHVWVQTMDVTEFEALKVEVRDWLDDGIGERDIELSPQIGRQGSAMAFFEGFPLKDLDALGVVIVEGDRPGSTYFAAELRVSVDEANAAASRMKLPIRFEEGEQW
jgi:hypothetical protein